MNTLYEFDNVYRQEFPVICGVDEAGRGALAGPVCCASVILNPQDIIEGLDDSKKLTAKKRDILFEEIINRAIEYKVVFIDEKIIDEINILQATMKGMKQAILTLETKPDITLIDGNACPKGIDQHCECVVKGDAKSATISAASILAKVSRDRLLCEMGLKYPEYKLEKHKGYGTKIHYETIEAFGLQEFHRRSFFKKSGDLRWKKEKK